jgi:hypothetical protein
MGSSTDTTGTGKILTDTFSGTGNPISSNSQYKECSECTIDKPCGARIPAGDGCNTCDITTWCVDGKWFRKGMMLCTLMGCGSYELTENPFKEKK